MKAMALYLPAFHRSAINDQWWGEGFTEWDNVRSGEIMYKGHVQPVHPIKEYYYDLSKKKDIEQQIHLANQYNVAGFIMYHYWFSSKDQIFSKPAEIIRDEIKDKIEYCFCWANESWITTWHGRDPDTILEQTYGDSTDWEKHIRYLATFFKDPRYSRINGRPVLYIYRPNAISQYEEMIKVWNRVLNELGEQPIYIIEFISSKNRKLYSQSSDAVTEFEPLYSCYFDISPIGKIKRAICKLTKSIDFQSYDFLWKRIINRKRTYSGKKIIKGCFVAWDNTPRRQKAGMIVRGANPQKFEKYLRALKNKKRIDSSNEYLVINAWNEWSEGAFLEPSQEYGYRYLEAVKKVFGDSNGQEN